MSTETTAAKHEAAPAGGGNKLMVIMMGVNSLLLAGVLALTLLKPGGGGEAKKPAAGEHAAPAAEHGEEKKAEGGHGAPAAGGHGEGAPGGIGPTLKLPDFVVHLRNPEADRFARITFEVEVGSELDKNSVSGRMPKIRDAFLAYLSDRTVEELRGSEGLDKTKAELKQRLALLVPGANVRNLYVTDIVVQ